MLPFINTTTDCSWLPATNQAVNDLDTEHVRENDSELAGTQSLAPRYLTQYSTGESN